MLPSHRLSLPLGADTGDLPGTGSHSPAALARPITQLASLVGPLAAVRPTA